jgi:hypothetical protein
MARMFVQNGGIGSDTRQLVTTESPVNGSHYSEIS